MTRDLPPGPISLLQLSTTPAVSAVVWSAKTTHFMIGHTSLCSQAITADSVADGRRILPQIPRGHAGIGLRMIDDRRRQRRYGNLRHHNLAGCSGSRRTARPLSSRVQRPVAITTKIARSLRNMLSSSRSEDISEPERKGAAVRHHRIKPKKDDDKHIEASSCCAPHMRRRSLHGQSTVESRFACLRGASLNAAGPDKQVVMRRRSSRDAPHRCHIAT